MRLIPVVGSVAALVAACACTSSGTGVVLPPVRHHQHRTHAVTHAPRRSHPASSATPTSAAPSTTAAPQTLSLAQRELAVMSLPQRVGQLLMVDCPSSGVSASTVESIRRWHAGSVILDGDSNLGVRRTKAITTAVQQLAPARVQLFVATDQEGGLVQRLKGSGFSTIPSAVAQGGIAPVQLRADTHTWGRQLRAAGVNLDLAPVLDTVPPGDTNNPPIGDLDREYGHTPVRVMRHGLAVARGLADVGIDTAVKHFPGLGRVTANTDLQSGVTDDVTTRSDPYLQPFASAIQAHVPFVMVSTADYSRIDPGTPAIFSPTIVTGMLRRDLGFRGVIITDDVGGATQVAAYRPGERAVSFVQAGGTMVLTVVPSTVGPMATRLIDRARHDPAFLRKIDAAALVVLRAKQARGLLH